MNIEKGHLIRFVEHSFVGAVENKEYLEALKYQSYMGIRKKDGWKIDQNYLDRLSSNLVDKSGQFPLSMELNYEIHDFLYRLIDWKYDEEDLMQYWKNKSTFIRNSFRLISNYYQPDYNEIFSDKMKNFLKENNVDVAQDLIQLDRGVIFMEYEYASVLESYFDIPEWTYLDKLSGVLGGITFCTGILKSPTLVGIGVPVDELDKARTGIDKYRSYKFQDLFVSRGKEIEEDLKRNFFSNGLEVKEKLFWTTFLCVCHESGVLKVLPNKVYVEKINTYFKQNYTPTNITTFTHFKRGDWSYPDTFDFSFI